MKHHPYEDILYLPYKKSSTHKPMSLLERAAQFSPFSALSGHKESLQEQARYTSEKRQLAEDQKWIINEKLNLVLDHPDLVVTIHYFKADARKEGGQYHVYQGMIKKVDTFENMLIVENKKRISFDTIIDIELEDYY